MKKKFLSVLLATAMVFTLAGCGKKNDASENTATPTTAATTDPTAAPTEAAATTAPTATGDANQLIIGDTTQSNGDVEYYWTNNASDYNVLHMVSGYEVVSINQQGKYVLNETAVKEATNVENSDGSKTYTFKLQEDLKWSNGDPVTAKDYVFGALAFSSKVFAEGLEAQDATDGYRLLGYQDFYDGKTKEFKGVRLLGDYEFSLTISPEYLPNYYELSLVAFGPAYMKGWVPADVELKDDGNGAYFSDNFTAEHIKDTVDAFRWNHTAFSGPYVVDSYDNTTNTYVLKVNPNFKGNFEGQKAQIETVIYKYVLSETVMDELKTGSIDMYCTAAEGPEINAGLDLVDQGGFNYVDYDRNGYGKLVFVCDAGPTQFVEVRHAIAYLLDRNEFAKTFTGGFGTVVNGSYGTSQWMVEEAEDEVAALNPYSYSLDSAIAELEKGGWVLDKDGNAYTSGVRYKKLDDGTLMPLEIEWCSSENNTVSDLLVTMLQNNKDVIAAGIKINQTVMSFNELITYYQGEPGYHMFNMGTGFTPDYNQTRTYEVGGGSNFNRIADADLAKLAKDMVLVTPGDDDAFLAEWVKFQQKWNELLPDLPLYSNNYHDFFNAKLQGYEGVNAIWDVAYQLPYCTIAQ